MKQKKEIFQSSLRNKEIIQDKWLLVTENIAIVFREEMKCTFYEEEERSRSCKRDEEAFCEQLYLLYVFYKKMQWDIAIGGNLVLRNM